MYTVLRSAFDVRKSLERKAGKKSVGDPQPLVAGFWSEVDWWQNKSKTKAKQNKSNQSKAKQIKTKQIKTQQNHLRNNQNHLQKNQTRCKKKKLAENQKIERKTNETKQNHTTLLNENTSFEKTKKLKDKSIFSESTPLFNENLLLNRKTSSLTEKNLLYKNLNLV